MLHVSPEAYRSGEVLPHSFVLPNGFLALLDEGFKTVLLYLILTVKTELLFDFDFNGKTVRVPSGFTRYVASLHPVVTRYHILDYTGENVTYVRLAVSCRRPVIESIFALTLVCFKLLFKYFVVVPEFQRFVFALYEIHVCRHLVIHNSSDKIVGFIVKIKKPGYSPGNSQKMSINHSHCHGVPL